MSDNTLLFQVTTFIWSTYSCETAMNIWESGFQISTFIRPYLRYINQRLQLPHFWLKLKWLVSIQKICVNKALKYCASVQYMVVWTIFVPDSKYDYLQLEHFWCIIYLPLLDLTLMCLYVLWSDEWKHWLLFMAAAVLTIKSISIGSWVVQ